MDMLHCVCVLLVCCIYAVVYSEGCTFPLNKDKTYTHHKAGDDLSISVSTDGTYSVSVKGEVYVASAQTYFNAYNTTYNSSDGTLKLVETDATSGSDAIGAYQATEFRYQIKHARIIARIKVYSKLSAIIFEQEFVDALEGTQAKTYEGLCGGFPGFAMQGTCSTLGYLSFGGLMFGDTSKRMGLWDGQTTNINDGITGGPLAMYNPSGDTIVLSPFNNFMSASFLHDKKVGGNYYGGIMGGVSSIPTGYTQSFILYYAPGINKAFEGWGTVLRNFYGKSVYTQRDDFTLKYLGYWTDNGAYYYFVTEPNKTYDVTLFDVKSYADQMKIPYRYFQFDAWWYYTGFGRGVKTWTSRPDIFPEGLENVTKKLTLPVAGHNRDWSPDVTYAKQNGGKYDFIVEKYKALPLTKEFWLDLLTEAKQWGLVTYEQDFLNEQFSGMKALLHDLFLGSNWLTNMAEAAKEKGLSIQYCMSNPRHAMQSLLYPAVTQARVSNDYQAGEGNWKIGISSIFAAAMGIAPSKDNFWTTEVQPGNKYKMREPNSKLNSIVSTLSTGIVGPSDMVGRTNRDLLMKCCNQDGLILKPQFPARAIDAQILQETFGNVGGPEGEVWLSYTEINELRFGNLLGVDIKNGTQYTVYPDALGIYGLNESLLAVPYDDPKSWVTFSRPYGITYTDKFKPDRPALYHISPLIPNWPNTTVFGELDKWVPMSPQRVLNMVWTNETIALTLQGAPYEKFTMWFVFNGKLKSVNCIMNPFGSRLLEIEGTHGSASC